MPASNDPQDVRLPSDAEAKNADQPTASQRRVRELLSSASTRRDQLLLWIAQSVARALAQDADQPRKGHDHVEE